MWFVFITKYEFNYKELEEFTENLIESCFLQLYPSDLIWDDVLYNHQTPFVTLYVDRLARCRGWGRAGCLSPRTDPLRTRYKKTK